MTSTRLPIIKVESSRRTDDVPLRQYASRYAEEFRNCFFHSNNHHGQCRRHGWHPDSLSDRVVSDIKAGSVSCGGLSDVNKRMTSSTIGLVGDLWSWSDSIAGLSWVLQKNVYVWRDDLHERHLYVNCSTIEPHLSVKWNALIKVYLTIVELTVSFTENGESWLLSFLSCIDVCWVFQDGIKGFCFRWTNRREIHQFFVWTSTNSVRSAKWKNVLVWFMCILATFITSDRYLTCN